MKSILVYWNDGHEPVEYAYSDYTMWLLKTDKDVKCVCSAETGEVVFLR